MAHRRCHTGDKPYQCTVCSKAFVTYPHGDTYWGKTFNGDICNKASKHKSHQTVHMRSNTGEEPYQYVVCSKDFTQSNSLNTHRNIDSTII